MAGFSVFFLYAQIICFIIAFTLFIYLHYFYLEKNDGNKKTIRNLKIAIGAFGSFALIFTISILAVINTGSCGRVKDAFNQTGTSYEFTPQMRQARDEAGIHEPWYKLPGIGDSAKYKKTVKI